MGGLIIRGQSALLRYGPKALSAVTDHVVPDTLYWTSKDGASWFLCDLIVTYDGDLLLQGLVEIGAGADNVLLCDISSTRRISSCPGLYVSDGYRGALLHGGPLSIDELRM